MINPFNKKKGLGRGLSSLIGDDDADQDEDDVVIEEDNVSGDLTDVKIDRSRYSKINIISR